MVSGSFLAGLSFVLSVLQTIVQVPLLLKFWSPSEYGMWMAVLAATSLVTRLDIGHQSFVGNLFNRYWVEDKVRLRAIFASGVLGALLIAGVELGAGILLFLFGKTEWLSGSLPEGAGREDFRIAFFAYLIFWVAQGSVGGILARLYQPAGLFARAQAIGIVYYLAGFFALTGSVALGASIVGAMLAQIGAWVVCNLFMFWDVRRKFPEFYPWWQGGNLALAWKNLRASLVLTINSLVDQAGSSGIVLLVMGILAPLEVAMFTTIRTVGNTALQGISVILYPVMPDIVRYHFQREPEKLDAVFGLVWCAAGSLVCLGFSATAPVLAPLYGLWTRNALPFSPVLFTLVVLAVCFRQWAAPLQTYLHGINHLAPQTLAIILRTAGTLSLGFLFLKQGGIAVAGAVLLVGEILAAGVYFFAARNAFHKLGGKLSLRAPMISLLQIGVMATGLACGVGLPTTRIWSVPLAVGGVLALGIVQWTHLGHDVKRRILGLLPDRLFKSFTPQ